MAGASGAAGAAGGAAGNGATAIQRIQDGTVATGAVVSVANVFVTALKVATSGNVTLVVQEPEGITTSGHTYPEYAGVQVFITAAESTSLGALASISPGDCISFTGTTAEFQSATQVGTLTALSKTASTATCGTFPTPLDVPSEATFAEIATDTSGTTGDQAGTKAEMFESVLVSVSNVVVSSAGATSFRVRAQGGATNVTLLVDSFLYSFTVPAVSTTYTQITGVYNQAGATNANYRLDPRGVLDFQ